MTEDFLQLQCEYCFIGDNEQQNNNINSNECLDHSLPPPPGRDIIDFDFFYNERHHPHKKVSFTKTYVTEVPKVVEIKDAYHNLWYKVALEEDNRWRFLHPISVYRVKVVYFRYSHVDNLPLIIVDKPELHEQPIFSYDKALAMFNEYVKTYSALVKSHMRDVLDIDIYAEKIDYKVTCPKCCFTCKYCKRTDDFKALLIHDHEFAFEKDYIIGITGNLVCTNPLNQKEPILGIFDNDRHHNGYEPEHYHTDMHHKCNDGYPYCHPDNHHEFKVIHPKVSILGVCKNYTKGENIQYKPIAGESMMDLIDRRIYAETYFYNQGTGDFIAGPKKI